MDDGYCRCQVIGRDGHGYSTVLEIQPGCVKPAVRFVIKSVNVWEFTFYFFLFSQIARLYHIRILLTAWSPDASVLDAR